MSEQQFVLDKLYYTIMTPIEKISVGRCYMTYMEVVDTLNEQQATIQSLKEENGQLKQKIQRWKTLYEIKDKEVTARVDALNEVCEYYLTEARFKADTDPNEAVKEVINRILNTEVGNDE